MQLCPVFYISLFSYLSNPGSLWGQHHHTCVTAPRNTKVESFMDGLPLSRPSFLTARKYSLPFSNAEIRILFSHQGYHYYGKGCECDNGTQISVFTFVSYCKHKMCYKITVCVSIAKLNCIANGVMAIK